MRKYIMTAHTLTRRAMADMVRRFLTTAKQPHIRSLSEFATDLTLPSGPYAGQRFRFHRLPYGKLLYDAIDSGKWQRFVIVGPVQGGKTWHSVIVPTLYYLFEQQENVIFGMPTEDMGADKWLVDLKPVIDSSGFAHLVPDKGRGSRGGIVDLIQFANGCRLKFMSGQGGDEKRSGYSSRIIVMTECDKMDDPRDSSDEADPITQIENRAGAYEETMVRIFMECTISHTKGRINQEYQKGTASRIACPCPYCREYVTPEREHLVGWEEASTEAEAGRLAHFVCPKCKQPFTEEDRRNMNKIGAAVLVHRGQEIMPNGAIVGDLPETRTLGFRWNAFNNLMKTTSEFGRREFLALRSEDPISAEREMKQFVWVLPADPDIEELKELSAVAIRERKAKGYPRGLCPENTLFVSSGIDIGKAVCWAVYIAWTHESITPKSTPEEIYAALNNLNGEDRRLKGHIIDYQSWKLDTDRDTEAEAAKIAIKSALTNYLNYYQDGFPVSGGGSIPLMYAGIDSGWLSEAIYSFCGERRFIDCFPIKGFGQSVVMPKYTKPKNENQNIRFVGNQYHLAWIPSAASYLIETNADYWKGQVRERISITPDNPLALVLFDSPSAAQHARYTMHLMSEQPVIKHTELGDRIVWQKKAGGGPNHLFDATAYATMMGSYCMEVWADRAKKGLTKKETSQNVESDYLPQNFEI